MEDQGDSEQNRTFRTHAAYLRSFRRLMFGGAAFNRENHLPRLSEKILEAYEGKVHRITAPVDEHTIKSCLCRAWGTEAILSTTSALAPDGDILRLALAWGAVQTYYACYNSVQGVLVAEGKRRSEQHNATQKQVVELWANRSVTLAPWSLAATEPGPRFAGLFGFLNGPNRPLDLTIHPWTTLRRGQEWDLAAKALRTTRDEKVDGALKRARDAKRAANIKAWKADEADRLALGKRPRKVPDFPRPRLTESEKEASAKSVRAVTMLDYLYRLRIKANYIDDEVFSQGPEDDEAALEFASSLQDLVAGTLLAHELRLCKLLGRRQIVREAGLWLRTHPMPDEPGGLAERRELLASA